MFGMSTKAANGTQAGGPRYVDRVARLLAEDSEFESEPIGLMSPSEASSEGCTEREAEDRAVHATEPADSDSGKPCTDRTQTTEHQPAELPQLTWQGLEEGTRRIAEALWGLAQAPQEALERARQDQERLGTAFQAIDRVSGDLCKVQSDLAGVREEQQAGSQRAAELRATLTALEDRWGQGEESIRGVRDRVQELVESRGESTEQVRNLKGEVSNLEARVSGLNQALDGLDLSLKSCSQAVAAVSSHCESLIQDLASLQQRQAEQTLAIEQLQADNAHTGSLMDNLVASLRGLDGRAERRRSVDKEIRVVKVGEAETTIHGQIVDASDRGLGLKLSAAVPVGSQVQLDVDGTLLLGEVAHCRRRGDWFTAGLRAARQAEAHVN